MNPVTHPATHVLQRWLRFLVILVAGWGSVCAAVGDTVYRCGNVYSQVPCPDADTLEVEDVRSPEQRKQTDAAARTAAKLARDMEKERLAQERKAAMQGRTPARAAALPFPTTQDQPVRLTLKRVRPAKPGHFIAEVPGSEPASPPAKKTKRKAKKSRSKD
ncbi:hypothetical protein [Candidatus Symbiobacter mobilis]|uniref:DUF4124 domain-containing protein n=1 Tax=Candidatus Symbiobacter mobilis CR TaxID=946483 RepID=U5N6U6_9BURK|nr:hypothetical protein [Candidatus Symbiobacter mobilis]AGX87261.1 hypothetical protein Cenrod_1168 [Candidatus Symbiobacter mobilis CR]